MYSLKTLVRIQDSVYSVDKIVISEFIETKEQLEKIKFEENSTHVFSNNTQTFFCTEIEEASIIEETVATPAREMITQFTWEIVETIYPSVSEEMAEVSEKEIIEN